MTRIQLAHGESHSIEGLLAWLAKTRGSGALLRPKRGLSLKLLKTTSSDSGARRRMHLECPGYPLGGVGQIRELSANAILGRRIFAVKIIDTQETQICCLAKGNRKNPFHCAIFVRFPGRCPGL